MGRKFAAGQVIWANITDRSGNNPKSRPLLVLENMGTLLRCLAISTDPKNDPADPAIEIEWKPDGTAATGLLAWCRVVLKWQTWVDPSKATLSGRVTKEYLKDVVEARHKAIH